jgi:uncharacterized membrane protein
MIITDRALMPGLLPLHSTTGQARAFELWPHRSLGRNGTHRLLAGVAIAFSVVAVRQPAPAMWPVALACLAAFIGLALALWANNRSGRLVERIVIDPRSVKVVRSQPARESQVAEFNTSWVRVLLTDDRQVSNRLTLTESGRSVSVGEFLSPEERAQLAEAMRMALAELRAACFPHGSEAAPGV